MNLESRNGRTMHRERYLKIYERASEKEDEEFTSDKSAGLWERMKKIVFKFTSDFSSTIAALPTTPHF